MGAVIEVIKYIDMFVYCRCATLKNYRQQLEDIMTLTF